MDLNKAIVCGRLTRDPEGKVLESGTPIASFSIASNRRYTKDGQQQEEVEYHNVVVFGKQGEACAAHLRQGNTALVEGRLKTRSWEHEGVKHYRTEIIADRVIFGPKSVSADDSQEERTAPDPAPSTKTVEYPTEDIDPNDIPF